MCDKVAFGTSLPVIAVDAERLRQPKLDAMENDKLALGYI